MEVDLDAMRALLDKVCTGALDAEGALAALATPGFAVSSSPLVPVTFSCAGESPPAVAAALARLAGGAGAAPVLGLRADAAAFAAVRELLPNAQYQPLARMIIHAPEPLPLTGGRVAVITAGTADIPVAEEAVVTVTVMGCPVDRIYDVGVAGLHRLLAHLERIRAADVLVVVAGMEGALPSVVGALVRRPLVAVPTSTGYGTSYGGATALLGMLNSSAPGVTVAGIDGGFSAGYVAGLIAREAAGATPRAGRQRSGGQQ